jgi:putative copper export protein
MYSYVLLAHLIAATIWTGGHLALSVAILPRALAARDPAILVDFEAGFERVGLSALAVQVATGLWMAHVLVPDVSAWFAPDSLQSRLVAMKLALLGVTVLTAADARLRIVPRLTAATLPAMARRIVVVTIASVGFVVVGASFRGGLLP